MRGKRGKAFWRNGDAYSIALEPTKGTWYDHRDGRGGGALALVEIALGCNRRSALQWLEGKGFIEPRMLTHGQRCDRVRRSTTAGTMASDIAYWRSAFIMELGVRKVAAAEAGCDAAFARAASLCNVLENGRPEKIVREFIRHRKNTPWEVARLIAAGRERDLESQRITGEVVLLLARAATGDSHDAA